MQARVLVNLNAGKCGDADKFDGKCKVGMWGYERKLINKNIRYLRQEN